MVGSNHNSFSGQLLFSTVNSGFSTPDRGSWRRTRQYYPSIFQVSPAVSIEFELSVVARWNESENLVEIRGCSKAAILVTHSANRPSRVESVLQLNRLSLR